MKVTPTKCTLALLVCALALPASVQAYVVPVANAATPATATFLGPLTNSARTYQLLIHENQLTGLVGQQLNGLTWRIPPNATSAWPTADVNFTDYDIYLSGSVDPANRSLTFADNVVGTQTQVRSGGLSIAANSYPFGQSPNGFGPSIGFSPYPYTGGNLLVEIRHSGFSGTSRSVEAVPATGGAAFGYGTDFSAAWAAGYTSISGNQGNFAVLDFSAVPEPAGLAIMVFGAMLLSFRRMVS